MKMSTDQFDSIMQFAIYEHPSGFCISRLKIELHILDIAGLDTLGPTVFVGIIIIKVIRRRDGHVIVFVVGRFEPDIILANN